MPKHKKNIAKIKGKILSILSESIEKDDSAYVMLDAILNRFMHDKFDSVSSEKYSQLSSQQKKILNHKVEESIITSSLTASGKGSLEKAGDIIPQTSAGAKKQLNIAYKFMTKLAGANIPLSVEIIVELQRIIKPEDPGLRTKGLTNYQGVSFVHSDKIKILLNNLINFIHNPPPEINLSIVEIIAQSVFLSIHPFRDGNGRTSMLFTTYISILHDAIPQIFTDFQQRYRFVMFHQINFDILKKGNADAIIAQLSPVNLTPYCIKQLQDARYNVPKSWLFDGKKLSYSQIQFKVAESMIDVLSRNHKASIETIEKLKTAQPLVKVEENAFDNLLYYLLESFHVILKKPGPQSVPLYKKLFAISIDRFSIDKLGVKFSTENLNKVIKFSFNELDKKLFTLQTGFNSENLQVVQNTLNRLQKLWLMMRERIRDSSNPRDIYEFSTLVSELKPYLHNINISFAKLRPPLNGVWLLYHNLFDLAKELGLNHCYASPFISTLEFKTCVWDSQPKEVVVDQPSSAIPRAMPWSGFSLIAMAAAAAGYGVGEVMLGIFAVYFLGKQVSKIFSLAPEGGIALSASSVILLRQPPTVAVPLPPDPSLPSRQLHSH